MSKKCKKCRWWFSIRDRKGIVRGHGCCFYLDSVADEEPGFSDGCEFEEYKR